MSGRALEAIARHCFPQERGLMLGAGLKMLFENKIIDERLYQWGRALQDERNLAAHASSTNFDYQDADDIFKFTHNICEYVFVLSVDFEDFMRRKAQRTVPRKIAAQ